MISYHRVKWNVLRRIYRNLGVTVFTVNFSFVRSLVKDMDVEVNAPDLMEKYLFALYISNCLRRLAKRYILLPPPVFTVRFFLAPQSNVQRIQTKELEFSRRFSGRYSSQFYLHNLIIYHSLYYHSIGATYCTTRHDDR